MTKMTMAPDDLRALADALEPMAAAPRFDGLNVPAFCAWLRAQADAQPVAWTARHTSVTRFALWLFINNALARSERAAQKGSYEPVENVAKYQDDAKTAEEARAMLAAAPAAPHHAMLDSHRRLVEQAIHTAEHPSGMSTHDGKARIDASVLRRMLAIIDSLPAAPQAEPIDPHMIVAEDRFPDEQAEPKREPLHKLLEYADLSDDCQYGTLSASVVRDLVNEALGIGGSDAE